MRAPRLLPTMQGQATAAGDDSLDPFQGGRGGRRAAALYAALFSFALLRSGQMLAFPTIGSFAETEFASNARRGL